MIIIKENLNKSKRNTHKIRQKVIIQVYIYVYMDNFNAN